MAIESLIENINDYYGKYNKTIIVSLLKTKDYKKIIRKLMKIKDVNFYFTSGNDKERYIEGSVLQEEALKYSKNKKNIESIELEEIIRKIIKEKTTNQTTKKAVKEKEKNKNTNKNQAYFILGSFYVYKDVKKYIDKYRK